MACLEGRPRVSCASAMPISRRRFLQLAALTLVPAGLGAYTWRYEPHALRLERRRIEGLGFREPLRVLHLSDFHASAVVPWDQIQRALQRGIAERPDLVFLTGDFVTDSSYSMAGYPDCLKPLAGHPHCYACFGNHDGSYRRSRRTRELRTHLEQGGVRVLFNEAKRLQIKGSALTVAGLGELWHGESRAYSCLRPEGARSAEPVLLLAHNPDTKDHIDSYAWDVMFAGHTHGGQFVLPLLGWRPFLPVRDKRYVAGHYRWSGRHLHITRGVGNLHGLRFNCPPEISIVDLS